MCFCSVLQGKKLFQFYRLLKYLFLFGITKKKKKLLHFFFRLYYICYRLYQFFVSVSVFG